MENFTDEFEDSLTEVTGNKPSGEEFTSLYPAIVECFSIILLGYITGRAGWISSTQTRGLNFFTSKVALPALLFSNMATLNWDQVSSLLLFFIHCFYPL